MEDKMNLGAYLSAPVFLSFITPANVMAAVGGLLYVASISMKTLSLCAS
jgi:hypothetical protein